MDHRVRLPQDVAVATEGRSVSPGWRGIARATYEVPAAALELHCAAPNLRISPLLGHSIQHVCAPPSFTKSGCRAATPPSSCATPRLCSFTVDGCCSRRPCAVLMEVGDGGGGTGLHARRLPEVRDGVRLGCVRLTCQSLGWGGGGACFCARRL